MSDFGAQVVRLLMQCKSRAPCRKKVWEGLEATKAGFQVFWERLSWHFSQCRVVPNLPTTVLHDASQ